MSGEIEVEWVGGPNDGKRFTMRGYQTTVRVAEPPAFRLIEGDITAPALLDWDVPVRLTSKGYRVFYHERTRP